MAELNDGEGALAYGDSILVGERVRLRGLRDDDLPSLARWEMDPGLLATLSNWVVPPSEAAAKERIAKWCANEQRASGVSRRPAPRLDRGRSTRPLPESSQLPLQVTSRRRRGVSSWTIVRGPERSAVWDRRQSCLTGSPLALLDRVRGWPGATVTPGLVGRPG